jgi:tRNA pseudouridine38-40 synthase
MPTWKLDIEYDGTRYGGWQQQPHCRTVQGEIVKAAGTFLKEPFEIGGSGRTDAGVHAAGQVAHLRVRSCQLSPIEIEIHLNRVLPHDINILRVRQAAEDFHARHSATLRYYLYQISTRRTAFGKPYVWWVKDRLDVKEMKRAASLILGMHNFQSFCEKTTESTLVKVTASEIATCGSLILFRIAASHFLWKMVRRLMGSLVEVGRARLTVEEFAHMLVDYSNSPAAWTSPPSGLFLERVIYKNDPLPGKILPIFPV